MEDTKADIESAFADMELGESNLQTESTKTVKSEQRRRKLESIKKVNDENVKLWESLMQRSGGKTEAYPSFRAVRNRPLTDATAVFHHNAWDDVEWDDEMETKAREAIENNSKTKVVDEKRLLLENEAGEYWNKFYETHQHKFFKDRNWLFAEFPELEGPFGCSVSVEEYEKGIAEKRKKESYPGEKSNFKLLEVGCGAGNTVFPLLSGNNNPEAYLYACDFSKTAVDIVRNHEKFNCDRCTPFVLDITEENPQVPFPPGSLDAIILIFVMSAITPEKFSQAVRNLHNFLKPGGLVLFRDYGRYDLAQLRFREGRCIADNFYMRGDGTRVYFFTAAEIEELFVTNGFSKVTVAVDRRLQVNRGKQLKMYRIWILAKFCKT